MVTHQDMVDVYGAENLVTLSREEADELRLHPDDAEVLVTIGLPRSGSRFFTTEVVGGPEFLTVIDLTKRDGSPHREVILGGPPGDPEMRYSVSAYERFIMLVQLERTPPRGEVVNDNLCKLIEFVYRFDRCWESGDPAELEGLTKTLTDLDPFSFEQPDDWWSIALHQAAGGGIL